MLEVNFNHLTPETEGERQANVAFALSRGLPEFDDEALSILTVVANGWSAPRCMPGGFVLALNGALRLPGPPPTYWAALDSQPLVADFLTNPPKSTTYLVASQCHPRVFERLAGREVRLWHLGEKFRQVPAAISITPTSLMLMRHYGVRRFSIWGWDCCLSPEGRHHAVGSSIAGPLWEVDMNGDRYVTTSPWLSEVNNAARVLQALEWSGAEFEIHGDGLIANMYRLAKSGEEARIEILREVTPDETVEAA